MISARTSAQTTLFSENFDGSSAFPTGWATAGSWSLGTGGGHSGTNYLRLSNTNSNKYLFTKTFTATAGFAYKLSYWDVATGTTGSSLAIYISNINPAAQNAANTNTSLNYVSSLNTSSSTWAQQTSQNWVCPASGTYFFTFLATTSSSALIKIDDISLIETPSCISPTLSPSSLSFSGINSEYLNLSWSSGNGDKTLIIASQTALTSNPVNGSAYTSSSIYGNGSLVANGYVVFNGPSSTGQVTITGLTRNTSYTFTVFSYNSGTLCYRVPGVSSSQASANLPIRFYVDNNSNANDVYTQGSASGSNSSNGKKLTPFATLTYALTQTIPGDTIYVDAGNYTDNALNSPAGGVHIVGAGISNTVFVNPSADSYFMSIDDNNTSLSGLTLRDYNAQTCGSASGQVLGISGATGVLITNVIIDQASTTSPACGYPVEIKLGANVSLSGGGQTCNSWASGGGVHISGATTSVNISNYLFYGNQNNGRNGTALRVDAGSVTIRNARFDSNESLGDQRGAAIFQQGGTLTVYDSWFNQNKTVLSYDQVGGTVLISGGTFVVKRSKFSAHTQLGGSTSFGAAIGVTGGNVTIDSCLFMNNIGSATRGKDVYNDGGTVISRYNTFNSGSNQIGSASGTFTLSNSGSPTYSYSSGLTFSNSVLSTYNPAPSVPSFSGACGSITLLPVEFLDFSGACQFGSNALHWSTASEHNNAYFTIERAGNDGLFAVLATIQGSQTTTSLTNYDFQDIMPLRDVNYYRLSQTDVNGDSQILKTISVDNNKCLEDGNGMFVFADQSGQYITIDYPFQSHRTMNIEIYNSIGQLIETQSLQFDSTVSRTQIHLRSSFSNGMYFLKLSDSSEAFTEKFMIRKQ